MTDPIKGAKKEGGVGFVKGMGRGIFGVPLRVMGGVFAVPGYAMKGLYQEALKNKGANVQNYIIAARMSQGNDEAQKLSKHEKDDMVSKWKIVKLNVKKKKNFGEDQINTLKKGPKLNPKFKLPASRPSFSSSTQGGSSADVQNRSPSTDAQLPPYQAHSFPRPPTTPGTPSQPAPVLNQAPPAPPAPTAAEEAERRELEAAIRASVSETSRGNPAEDEMIAQAIRASITELARPVSHDEDDEETLQRALKASIEEAGKHGATEEEKRMLEETLKNSLLEKGGKGADSENEWDDSDTEDDEEYQRILAESKELAHLHAEFPSDYAGQVVGGEQGQVQGQGQGGGVKELGDEELRKAIEESERAERERVEGNRKQKSEEEIVLEYVMKQSLVEEEHRRRLDAGRDVGGGSSGGGK